MKDAKERNKGVWHLQIDEFGGSSYVCPFCDCSSNENPTHGAQYNFCPWCGAEMEGGDEKIEYHYTVGGDE